MEATGIAVNAERSLEDLDAEIGRLSAHLSAATCRWLLLIAEFERREGYWAQGARTCAEWLSWRCGLSLVTARHHLQVARALEGLPVVREAFAAGELSYSKVRALCRIATPATEAELVELARHGTASHVDRLARARRTVARIAEREAEGRRPDRHVGWFYDDDGSLVLNARLDPDEGALVVQALSCARQALDDAAKGDGGPAGQPIAGASSGPAGPTAHHRPTNADALVVLADTMLAHGPAERDGGERYLVSVLADAEVLAGGGDGRCEIDGGRALEPEVAQMLACDARILALLRGGESVLNIGRETRVIPRRIRRALQFRDKGCRFPGCSQSRWVDGHHIVHWANGGETSLANLVLLCRFHHRAIHRHGFGVSADRAGGQLVFTTPAGDVLPTAPLPEGPVDLDPEAVERAMGVVIGATTGTCLWGGERMDLALAIDALLDLEGRG